MVKAERDLFMRVLVVSAADATNLSIQNVLIEMVSRGHHIEVFAQNTDRKSIRMFEELHLPIHSVKELSPKIVSRFDIAFCGTDAMDILRFEDIYVFCYNFLFNGSITAGADFMFTLCKKRNASVIEDCATMPIGIPKNDTPKTLSTKKQFLYIDAGHLPFAREGKVQLAKMLLNICNSFPMYKLVIKPRWLLTDTENLTHGNLIHIYNVLVEVTEGNLPDNLIMLQEHLNLQTLIDESETIITTSISCFLDATLRGKGVIVVEGLTNEDQCEMRINKSLKREYQNAAEAHCLVNYKNVVENLPKGKMCSNEYIDQLLPYRTGASGKIVDVIEYIYFNYLKLKKYPKIQNYEYETYKQEMTADKLMNIKELRYKRMKNSVLRASRMLDYIDAEIDYSSYFELLNETYHSFQDSENGYKMLLDSMVHERRKILIENQDKLMSDPINQAYLLAALYDEEQYENILNMPEDLILCKESYEFYLGRIYSVFGNSYNACEHYCKFLLEANKRTFCKFPQENKWGIKTAYTYLFKIYNGANIAPDIFAKLYVQLYEKHNENLLQFSLMQKVQKYLPVIAEEIKNSNSEIAFQCLSLYAKNNNLYNITPLRKKVSAVSKESITVKKSALYKIHNIVLWLPRKIRGGILCLKEHGWKYTVHRMIEQFTDWVKYKPFVRPFREFRANILPGYYQYIDLIHEFGEDSYIYLSAGGTGDVYISGLYYDKYIESKGNSKTAVYVLPGESCYQIATLFQIKRLKKIPRINWIDLLKLFRFMGDAVRLEMLYYHIFVVYTGCLTWIESYKGWNLYNLIHAVHFGNLDINDVQLPLFVNDEEELSLLFEENGLIPGRTVVLAPYAKWPPKIPEYFWLQLVKKLKEKGFLVCTNSAGKEEPAIQGSVAISFPYSIAVPFLEKAGYLVGLRSGFLDIVEQAKCKRVALYPYNCAKRGIANGTAQGSFSLNAMFNSHDWLELETRPDNLDDVIEKIISFYIE